MEEENRERQKKFWCWNLYKPAIYCYISGTDNDYGDMGHLTLLASCTLGCLF
jgi:hypothetical protein